MSTILSTVESYEDQVLDLVNKAQGPVVEYVAKGVELVEDRLPEVTYPDRPSRPPSRSSSRRSPSPRS